MDWKDVGKIVASAAPVLGGVLGGPLGIIAGAAGSLIASSLGVEADPASVSAAISSDPSSLVKLREIEAGERARLLEWQTEQLRADLANVTSAREREVRMAEAGSKAVWVTTVLAVAVTLGFFAMVYKVVSAPVGQEPSQASFMLLGILGSGFMAVIGYYFGSSNGSQFKTAVMAKAEAKQ